MPTYDVVGFGTAAHDFVTRVERFPAADEKVRSDELVVEGGGTTGNALVCLARLGFTVAFAGSVGEDEYGRAILKGLEREGVDTTHALVVEGARSPVAFCVSNPPRRAIFSIAATTPPRKFSQVVLEQLLDTRYVHVDGSDEAAALALVQAAHHRGVGVSLDLQRVGSRTEEFLASADIAIVSESFSRARYGGRPAREALAELYRDEMLVAAITLGALGSVARAGAEVFEIPAEEVEVVDSTGAGDAFHGAVLAAMLSGHSPEHALRLGAHVAALNCRALGARAALPVRTELGDDWL